MSSAAQFAAAPLVSARGISKSFAGIEVLGDVDLDLYPGEIHALLGENGAGKSTFAKILAGVFRPTRGTITFSGKRDGNGAMTVWASDAEGALCAQMTLALG